MTLPNEARGEFSVDINGSNYIVCFDALALMAVEEELEISFGFEPAERNDPFRVIPNRQKRGFVSSTVLLTWIGLQHHNPSLSKRDVAKMLTPMFAKPGTIAPLREGLMKAYMAAWGGPADTKPNGKDESKNALSASAGLGSDSPNSPAASG